MVEKSGAKENGEKSKEKNDAKSENDVISNERLDAEGTEDITAQSCNIIPSIDEVNPIQKQMNSISLKYLFLMCLPLLTTAFVLHLSSVNDSPSTTRRTSTLDIDAIMYALKPEIENQPEMSFRVIQTALEAVTETNPTAPAIILLLAAKGAESRSRHLGKKLVEAVSRNYHNITGDDYKTLNYDEGKKKIHAELHTLRENEYDAVLVEDLHLIPGNTALMFQSFWDQENAPFKRAVFVITFASGIIIPIDSKLKFWEETANNRLKKFWSDIHEDQRAPLLSRLTIWIAAIIAITSDLSSCDGNSLFISANQSFLLHFFQFQSKFKPCCPNFD